MEKQHIQPVSNIIFKDTGKLTTSGRHITEFENQFGVTLVAPYKGNYINRASRKDEVLRLAYYYQKTTPNKEGYFFLTQSVANVWLGLTKKPFVKIMKELEQEGFLVNYGNHFQLKPYTEKEKYESKAYSYKLNVDAVENYLDAEFGPEFKNEHFGVIGENPDTGEKIYGNLAIDLIKIKFKENFKENDAKRKAYRKSVHLFKLGKKQEEINEQIEKENKKAERKAQKRKEKIEHFTINYSEITEKIEDLKTIYKLRTFGDGLLRLVSPLVNTRNEKHEDSTRLAEAKIILGTGNNVGNIDINGEGLRTAYLLGNKKVFDLNKDIYEEVFKLTNLNVEFNKDVRDVVKELCMPLLNGPHGLEYRIRNFNKHAPKADRAKRKYWFDKDEFSEHNYYLGKRVEQFVGIKYVKFLRLLDNAIFKLINLPKNKELMNNLIVYSTLIEVEMLHNFNFKQEIKIINVYDCFYFEENKVSQDLFNETYSNAQQYILSLVEKRGLFEEIEQIKNNSLAK